MEYYTIQTGEWWHGHLGRVFTGWKPVPRVCIFHLLNVPTFCESGLWDERCSISYVAQFIQGRKKWEQ